MFAAELQSWLDDPVAEKFPYDVVVQHFHDVGKHFVRPAELKLLADARDRLPLLRGPWEHVRTLADFLSSALDKHDERYDYPTYLALPLLRQPTVDDPVDQAPFVRARCDRLVVHLMADALAFEIAAMDGSTALLPKMRPTADRIDKRCKHGLRAIRPALNRQSLHSGLTASEPTVLARQVSTAVRADMSLAEQRVIELSVLPVYTAHDEYMFLRVLQVFETTFALLAVQLRAAVAALAAREVDWATQLLAGSRTALVESAPLFSMLATMQVESFRTFRTFTEGASAIQSRNYKIVESLCRQPDRERLDSAAFVSVPDVRKRVLLGQKTLDDAYREACASGDVAERDTERLGEAMRRFARALVRWRNTHYRLAVRMLGEATGSGYTAGTPYLAAVRTSPVFHVVESLTRCE
nr:hypothetical protein; Hypothetical protein [Kibdelosporangium sp. MJ126-NF4]CTQ99087.1 hypothetical protein; Hypothetical protein [Kibdelosporangium sp. MJ126-NF4]